MNDKKDEIITLAETCEILGMHPSTLCKWDNKDFLQAIGPGSREIADTGRVMCLNS